MTRCSLFSWSYMSIKKINMMDTFIWVVYTERYKFSKSNRSLINLRSVHQREKYRGRCVATNILQLLLIISTVIRRFINIRGFKKKKNQYLEIWVTITARDLMSKMFFKIGPSVVDTSDDFPSNTEVASKGELVILDLELPLVFSSCHLPWDDFTDCRVGLIW